MLPPRLTFRFRRITLPMGRGVAVALALLTAASVGRAQNTAPAKNGDVLSPPSKVNSQAPLAAPNQKEAPQQTNLELTKADVAELAALADSLHDQLNKVNAHILSVDDLKNNDLKNTEGVDKLAKEIKRSSKKIKGDAHAR